MATKGPISMGELLARLQEICDGIERDHEVWEIEVDPGVEVFILGPESVCGRVLGLYDAEYGWPIPVDIDRPFSREDLTPGGRRHPFLMRGGGDVAVAVSRSEYDDILKLLARGAP